MNHPIPSILHITHEAAHHIGGIGTVLQGLLTSPSYQQAVGRSILLGPLWDRAPLADVNRRLGARAQVRYSSLDNVDMGGFAQRFRPIEERFNVRIVYGLRTIEAPDEDDPAAEVEVALIDVSSMWIERVHEVKRRLYEWCGLESDRHEHSDDYEQWVRLAAPACALALELLVPAQTPCLALSHEYMGMPTALWATMDVGGRFRTALHAHECATARAIVEAHPAHDSAFYPAMWSAMRRGRTLDQVFGDQSHNYRHELVRRAHRLDVTLAVGEATRDEMRFLDPDMTDADVRVCFNGVPHEPTSHEREEASRKRVWQWIERVAGVRPDWLITHVARPIVSKGLWRDLALLREMAPALAREGKRVVYLLLTCGGAPRPADDVARMAREYGWPRVHRESWPDLAGPEIDLWRDIESFNREAPRGTIVGLLVNQWGFSRAALGPDAPEDLSMADLRRAADAELGLSAYEPFGISPMEPLHAGAISVISEISGCAAFARLAARACGIDPAPNVLSVDFTQHGRADPLRLSRADLAAIESQIIPPLAHRLLATLPRSAHERDRLLERGVTLARRMQWEHVVREQFLPAVAGAVRETSERRAG